MKYNFVTEPAKTKRAVVITPTVGSQKIVDAVNSVAMQTYSNVEHLIVIDGPE